MTCTCGATHLPGALFCGECGSALSTSPPSTSSSQQRPAPHVILVVESSGRRLRLNLATPVRVGRSDPQRESQPDVDLGPDQGAELGVSRLHATIQVMSDRVVVVDLGSRNGTILNRQPLPPEWPYPLESGDEVCFGRLPVHVYVETRD